MRAPQSITHTNTAAISRRPMMINVPFCIEDGRYWPVEDVEATRNGAAVARGVRQGRCPALPRGAWHHGLACRAASGKLNNRPKNLNMHSDQNASPPRVEGITSVQRRRRWPTAEKIRLVEETMQPGMSASYVARRAGVPQLAVQLASTNAGRRPASGPG
jgi:hypothetical protein